MQAPSLTFALFFGNRGFFPEKLIASARDEVSATLKRLGFGALAMDSAQTRHGAVDGTADGLYRQIQPALQPVFKRLG